MVRRALANRTRRTARVPVPPGDEVTAFHRRAPGYRPTPLRALPGFGSATVDLKDESDRFGLPAFKILGASWAVERVLRRPSHTLVAASAGNHGRAVARCAALRGLRCRIFLPEATSPGRTEPILAEGAEVVRVAGGYDDAVTAAELAATEPGVRLVADVSRDPGAETPRWVADGYSTLFREAAEQADAPPDVVLVPVGVGALASAAVRWAVHEGRGAAVVGVEPAAAACVTESLRQGRPVTVPTPGTSMTGLDCATPSAVAWPVLRDGLAGTVTVDDEEVRAAMRTLAGLGLAIGDCGAAPIAALRHLLDADSCASLRAAVGLGRRPRVLCVATEGPTDQAAYRRAVADDPQA